MSYFPKLTNEEQRLVGYEDMSKNLRPIEEALNSDDGLKISDFLFKKDGDQSVYQKFGG